MEDNIDVIQTINTDGLMQEPRGGGGFGSEKYTLQFLYNEHQMGNNYWTTSNKHLDLVRYTGCKFKVFRHLHIDFYLLTH